jgi:hypothetical protein
VRPLPSRRPTGEATLDGHLGLTVYRALAEAHVANGFALDFHEESGLLRVLGFDARRGVEATFAIKVENEHHEPEPPARGEAGGSAEKEREEEQQKEEEELLAQCRRAIDAMAAALEAEQRLVDGPDDAPFEETVRWLGEEDPPEFGFRWDYVRSGSEPLAQVTLVLDPSSLGRAGLRRGDRIAAINGQPVATAPQFGRAIGGLRAGAGLALEVVRGAERLALTGAVEKASDVIPAYERRAIGAPLPAFHATLGGPPLDVGGAGRSGPTVVCLFDPRQPDTLRDAAVLAWLRDHESPARVAIAGIAARASDAATKAALDELACGWPAVADPDGRLTEATRTITLPALLVADRDGVVRFRQAHGARLLRAVRALLAEKR